MGRYKDRRVVGFKVDTVVHQFVEKTKYQGFNLVVNSDTIEEFEEEVPEGISNDDKMLLPGVKFELQEDNDSFRKIVYVVDRLTRDRLCSIAWGWQKGETDMTRFGATGCPTNAMKIYGAGFILRDMQWWFDKMDKWGIEWGAFRRVDLNIDLEEETDYITRTIFSAAAEGAIRKRAGIFLGRDGDIETLYIGDKKETNRFKLIRIYNKIVEIKKKGRNHLYPQYEGKKNVTRIELELRVEKLKDLGMGKGHEGEMAIKGGFKKEYLLDEEMLFKILNYELWWSNRQYFKFINYDDIKDLPRVNLTQGAAKAKMLRQKAAIEEFGHDFVTDRDAKTALATMKSLFLKLVRYGYTPEQMCQHMYNEATAGRHPEAEKSVELDVEKRDLPTT